MLDSDQQSWLEFGYYIRNCVDGFSGFFSKIMFTDEYMLPLNSHINTQSPKTWVIERPSEGAEEPAQSLEVMVRYH